MNGKQSVGYIVENCHQFVLPDLGVHTTDTTASKLSRKGSGPLGVSVSDPLYSTGAPNSPLLLLRL